MINCYCVGISFCIARVNYTKISVSFCFFTTVFEIDAVDPRIQECASTPYGDSVGVYGGHRNNFRLI